MKRSIETNSSSLKADAWHHRSDAITSVAAFTGISIALLMGKDMNLLMIGLRCLSGFICYNSYRIFRPALGEIMDEHLYDDLIESIRVVASHVEGIIDTEKCFT
jgi:divalent metal cation (Fe/Co/Zn/Cd) transporter